MSSKATTKPRMKSRGPSVVDECFGKLVDPASVPDKELLEKLPLLSQGLLLLSARFDYISTRKSRNVTKTLRQDQDSQRLIL